MSDEPELRICAICRVNEKDHATYFSVWNPRHDFEPELTVETCEGFKPPTLTDPLDQTTTPSPRPT